MSCKNASTHCDMKNCIGCDDNEDANLYYVENVERAVRAIAGKDLS